MSDGSVLTEHPHVVRTPGVCGGDPVVRGTRIPGRILGGCLRLGMSVEEILDDYPGLTPAGVYDALSYYHDHPDEMRELDRQNTLEYLEERFGVKRLPNGRLMFPGESSG